MERRKFTVDYVALSLVAGEQISVLCESWTRRRRALVRISSQFSLVVSISVIGLVHIGLCNTVDSDFEVLF